MLLAACSAAAVKPSQATAPTSAPMPSQASTPVPSPSEPSLQAAAAAYLQAATAYNAGLDQSESQLAAAGTDVGGLGQAYAAAVANEKKFIASVRAIAFPSSIEPTVNALLAVVEEQVSVDGSLARDPSNAQLQTDDAQLIDLETPVAIDLRQLLGLPPAG